MQRVTILILFLFHVLFLQAQTTTCLNSAGKKTSSKENAVIIYETRTIDENSFSIYESILNNGIWSKPDVKWTVIKKTEQTWHIYEKKKIKDEFRILEILDTLALGYKIKQSSHENKVLFTGDVIQLFPVILHGKSTFFDNEGLPMTEISFNQGARLNEALLFHPLDSNLVITRLPEYPGGSKSFLTDIAREIIYPVSGQLKNLTDIIYVKFLITIEGRMSNISVVGIDKNVLTNEARRVISSIEKKWEPALSNGIKIPVWHYAKITFGGAFVIN